MIAQFGIDTFDNIHAHSDVAEGSKTLPPQRHPTGTEKRRLQYIGRIVSAELA